MSDKSFFDMSGKQGMAFGFLAGIVVTGIIGFGVMSLSGKSIGDGAVTKTTGNTNVAPTPTPTPTPTPDAGGDFSKVPKVTNDDYIRGDKNAKVTMIEYSDFQCPFCQRHVPTLDKILADYKGKVRLIYRHFPLTSIHPNAQKSAEAAECAGEQGKFWEMHDKLFENQTALQVDNLKQYAKDLGLNTSQFNSCLDDGKYASKVNKQASEAQASGITGTPGTWVGDQLVKGAYPYDTFKQLVDAQLK